MIGNQTRHATDWYGTLRTPAKAAATAALTVHHERDELASLGLHLTADDQVLEDVLALEATATQYEDLAAGSRAVEALGRLKERIPVDLRGHVVTTCLFLAADRAEDKGWPALRERRDRARQALGELRAVAPAELVWEIDELLATGQWNTSKRFPRASVVVDR